MTRLIHLSDTHFGTERPEVMSAVVQSVHDLKPDIVTISGDITQRATRAQFHMAKKFLDLLPSDLSFVIPGNHDIPLHNPLLRLFTPYRYYISAFTLCESIWCHGNVGIIGFDATSRWRHTRGKLLEANILHHIKLARAQLDPGAILIACAHQPLMVGLLQDQKNILINAEETAKIFSHQGVDLVLSGHVHWPLITNTEEAFPNLKNHFVLSGAGTAISQRTRPGAPNSFNVIEIANKDSITITLMEYGAIEKKFTESLKKVFHSTAAGWKLHEMITTKTLNPDTISNYGTSRY